MSRMLEDATQLPSLSAIVRFEPTPLIARPADTEIISCWMLVSLSPP